MDSSAPLELAATVRASKAPAISRAAAVLRLLGKSGTPLGLQAIARDLGLVPSTCLYLLRALAEEGLVEFEPDTKRYSLGAGVLTLARRYLGRSPFAERAQPLLDRFAQRFDVTAMGVQVSGLDHMVVVATAQGGQNFRLSAEVGSRFPALISATGRCIAAFGEWEETELERRFKTLRWDAPPSFQTWSEEVAETRRRGFAVDEGNYMAGITVLAAPVWKASGGPSRALAAVGLSGVIQRIGIETLGPALVESARELSAQFGAVPA